MIANIREGSISLGLTLQEIVQIVIRNVPEFVIPALWCY